jgi:hypothetical protein
MRLRLSGREVASLSKCHLPDHYSIPIPQFSTAPSRRFTRRLHSFRVSAYHYDGKGRALSRCNSAGRNKFMLIRRRTGISRRSVLKRVAATAMFGPLFQATKGTMSAQVSRHAGHRRRAQRRGHEEAPAPAGLLRAHFELRGVSKNPGRAGRTLTTKASGCDKGPTAQAELLELVLFGRS